MILNYYKTLLSIAIILFLIILFVLIPSLYFRSSSAPDSRCAIIESIENGKSNWIWRYWIKDEAADIRIVDNRLEFKPLADVTWINLCVFDKSLGPIDTSEYRFLKIYGKGIEMIRVKVNKSPFESTCGQSVTEDDMFEKTYRYSYNPMEYVIDLSEVSGNYLYSIGLFTTSIAELHSILLCK
jgi:hypothetical protein